MVSKMEIDMDETISRTLTATPPIAIESPLPRRPAVPGAEYLDAPVEKLDFQAVKRNAAKKRRKRNANKQPPAPAAQTIRGFQTPITSGGEESDVSALNTPRFGPVRANSPSVTSSPFMRPNSAMGGISALKLQLDTLSLNRTSSPRPKRSPAAVTSNGFSSNMSSNDSVTSTNSDSEKTEMDVYEIPLENDFVSPLVQTKPLLPGNDCFRQPSMMSRKMAASDFEPLNCLGKGTYGTVLLVRQRETGRLYAQKQFRKASLTVHKKLVEQTKTERAILESVNRHPFIVNLYYAFQDQEKLYLILEYAQGGELFHHLSVEKMFSEDVASFYMAEMVLALEHLHQDIGVIYRDLKPENCLLDAEGHLLLTDFGLSKVAVDGDDAKSILGTIEYMAPEVIQGIKYGMAVDWWSLGALGFDLLTGSPPFTGNNHAKIQEKILKGKLQIPYYLGPDAKDLLTRLLRKEPNKRLGGNMPKDLQTIKKHRFFRKIDWKKLERREIEPPIKPLITDPALAENFDVEFTTLALSPVVTRSGFEDMAMDVDAKDPFGGFSFVASESLLAEHDGYLF
jgi:serine/threonine-protein kinase Psk1